jgi:hypothetical protein
VAGRGDVLYSGQVNPESLHTSLCDRNLDDDIEKKLGPRYGVKEKVLDNRDSSH